jgi:hypothetical protein
LLYRFGMTRALLLGFVLLTAACGDKSPVSLCGNQVPPPAACNTPCDPSPAAANMCPAGFHCSPEGKCDEFCTASGNQCPDGDTCTADGRCVGDAPCVGLQCAVADCAAMNKPPTTISGTVFAPNGTLRLYGISVYVPNAPVEPLAPFTPGVECGACANGLPGDPIVQTTTDDKGNFSLEGVPSGANIPVVITIGKWRRQLKIANVASCATQPLDAADTRLPASRGDTMTPNTTSVDLPQIAISTGSADSLECLVRRLGIADKEITTYAPAGTQSGKIHLFADTMAGGGEGTSSFTAGFGGGTGNLTDSQTLWGNSLPGPEGAGNLDNYDIVILSCEGEQHSETKPQEAMNHLKAYADKGGRVFLSHWHNIWLEGSTSTPTNGAKPAVWAGDPTTKPPTPPIATFSVGSQDVNPNSDTSDTIDEVKNPKGTSFASWMLNVQAKSPTRDQVTITKASGKHTALTVDDTKAERWVYWQKDAQTLFPQNFQFTTPNEAAPENRCGKVVFSDMHVSDSPLKDNNQKVLAYPANCGSATDLSDQEKALAFMFFDISSCVGVLF